MRLSPCSIYQQLVAPKQCVGGSPLNHLLFQVNQTKSNLNSVPKFVICNTKYYVRQPWSNQIKPNQTKSNRVWSAVQYGSPQALPTNPQASAYGLGRGQPVPSNYG